MKALRRTAHRTVPEGRDSDAGGTRVQPVERSAVTSGPGWRSALAFIASSLGLLPVTWLMLRLTAQMPAFMLEIFQFEFDNMVSGPLFIGAATLGFGLWAGGIVTLFYAWRLTLLTEAKVVTTVSVWRILIHIYAVLAVGISIVWGLTSRSGHDWLYAVIYTVIPTTVLIYQDARLGIRRARRRRGCRDTA